MTGELNFNLKHVLSSQCPIKTAPLKRVLYYPYLFIIKQLQKCLNYLVIKEFEFKGINDFDLKSVSKRKNEVRPDEARNLIDTSVAKNDGDFLVVNFVRQIQTDDASFDVDIGDKSKLSSIFFVALFFVPKLNPAFASQMAWKGFSQRIYPYAPVY